MLAALEIRRRHTLREFELRRERMGRAAGHELDKGRAAEVPAISSLKEAAE